MKKSITHTSWEFDLRQENQKNWFKSSSKAWLHSNVKLFKFVQNLHQFKHRTSERMVQKQLVDRRKVHNECSHWPIYIVALPLCTSILFFGEPEIYARSTFHFVINYIFAITMRIKAANICTTWRQRSRIAI